MKKSLAILAAPALLLGCATEPQRAALERDTDMMIQAYGPVCSARGYDANSRAWRNCIYQHVGARYSDSRGTEWNLPLIQSVGQKLGLIPGNRLQS